MGKGRDRSPMEAALATGRALATQVAKIKPQGAAEASALRLVREAVDRALHELTVMQADRGEG